MPCTYNVHLHLHVHLSTVDPLLNLVLLLHHLNCTAQVRLKENGKGQKKKQKPGGKCTCIFARKACVSLYARSVH